MSKSPTKYKLTIYLSFVVFFLSFFKAYTQEPLHYFVGKDIFEGVQLYSIVQDDDKSMWVSSNKGLYHYDGIHFNLQIPSNIKNENLFGLTKNNNGDIFCFNLYGQIYKLKNKKLELYYTIPDKYLGANMNITFDKDNILYVQSNIGFCAILPNKQLIEYKKVKKLSHTNKNNIDTLFFYFNPNFKRKIKSNYFKKRGYNLFSKKRFIVSTSFYVVLIDKQSKEVTNSFFTKNKEFNHPLDLFDIDTYSNCFNTDNDMWLSNPKKGVYRFPHDYTFTNKTTLSKPNKWFSNYFISGATSDVEGNIWLLTFNQGIIVIPNLEIKYISRTTVNDFKYINKKDKTIYVSNLDGNIYAVQGVKLKTYLKVGNKKVENFNFFNNGYVTTNNILFKNKKVETRKIGYSRTSLLIDSVFYFANIQGLLSYNIKTKERKFLTKNRITDIIYDEKTQKIWIASTKGLSKYKNNKEEKTLYNGKPIMVYNFTKVKNEIWAISKKGIHIFKGDSLHYTITKKDGLLSDRINRIRYVSPYVYLSSHKGIQQLNLQTNQLKNFTQNNGLFKKIINFEVLNDTLYGITSDGLLAFNLQKVKTNRIPKYQTKITNAVVNGTKKITNNAILKPNENNIDFSFLTTSFKYKTAITYQYQLIGYQKEKTKTRENEYVVKYPKLPPGKYTFVIDSFISRQKNKSDSLTFTILPHWYQSTWFKLLIVFTILGAIYSIYRIRLNQVLRKRDKAAMQKRLAESTLTSLKAQMNPHFMFNAMNSIQSLVLEGKKYEAYEYLSQISDFVRKNLDMSNVAFIDFEKELNFCRMYLELEKLRFEDTFNYDIKYHLQSLSFKIPSMIIQPFLENAVKHGLLHKTNDRKLNISFHLEDEILICIIEDNGVGREASLEINQKKQDSFSTGAIKNRFEILREYYKIDIGFKYVDLYKNKKASGTKVVIKIPISYE